MYVYAFSCGFFNRFGLLMLDRSMLLGSAIWQRCPFNRPVLYLLTYLKFYVIIGRSGDRCCRHSNVALTHQTSLPSRSCWWLAMCVKPVLLNSGFWASTLWRPLLP